MVSAIGNSQINFNESAAGWKNCNGIVGSIHAKAVEIDDSEQNSLPAHSCRPHHDAVMQIAGRSDFDSAYAFKHVTKHFQVYTHEITAETGAGLPSGHCQFKLGQMSEKQVEIGFVGNIQTVLIEAPAVSGCLKIIVESLFDRRTGNFSDRRIDFTAHNQRPAIPGCDFKQKCMNIEKAVANIR